MNIHCWGSGVWCCLWPRDLVNIVYQPDCDGYVCESDDVRGLESGARENRICLLLGVSKCGHPQLHVCGNFPEHLRLPGCKAACEGSRKGSVDLRVERKQRICVSRGQWADPAGSLTLGQQLRLGCLQGECRGLLDLENGHKTGIDAKQWAWVECAGGGVLKSSRSRRGSAAIKKPLCLGTIRTRLGSPLRSCSLMPMAVGRRNPQSWALWDCGQCFICNALHQATGLKGAVFIPVDY